MHLSAYPVVTLRDVPAEAEVIGMPRRTASLGLAVQHDDVVDPAFGQCNRCAQTRWTTTNDRDVIRHVGATMRSCWCR